MYRFFSDQCFLFFFLLSQILFMSENVFFKHLIKKYTFYGLKIGGKRIFSNNLFDYKQ